MRPRDVVQNCESMRDTPISQLEMTLPPKVNKNVSLAYHLQPKQNENLKITPRQVVRVARLAVGHTVTSHAKDSTKLQMRKLKRMSVGLRYTPVHLPNI